MHQIDYFFRAVAIYLPGGHTAGRDRGQTRRYDQLQAHRCGGPVRSYRWHTPKDRHPSRQEYRAQELVRQAKKLDMPFNLKPAHWPTNGA